MNIGITISTTQPLPYSGARQTAAVLEQLFTSALHHTVYLVDPDADASDAPNKELHLLIDVDARLTAQDRQRLGSAITQHIVFLRGTLAFTELDSIAYMEDPYVPRNMTGVKEVWCWDEVNPAASLDALAPLFPCPIRRVPMVWAPLPFLDLPPPTVPDPQGMITLRIMEKNTSNTSSSVLAMVAVREWMSPRHRSPVLRVRVHNMDHLRESRYLKENILDNVEWSTACGDVALLPRDAPDHSFLSWPRSSTLVLSHSRFTPLRWGLLFLVWHGLPVLHNSPLLRDLHPLLQSAYYEGNKITDDGIIAAGKHQLSQLGRWQDERESVHQAIQTRWGITARAQEWSVVLSSLVSVSLAAAVNAAPHAGKTYRIGFACMWPGFSPSRNYFMDALRHHAPDRLWESAQYDPSAADAPLPDLVVFGPYGDQWKKIPPSIPRVFFSAENWPTPTDPTISLSLTASREEDATHLRVPTWAIFIDWYTAATTLPTDPSRLEENPIRLPLHFAMTPHPVPFSQRSEFCAFVVSNPSCSFRNDTFHALNAYKPVRSGGGLFNTIGGQLALKYAGGGCGDVSKHHFFAEHRFTISFENSQSPGYLTEKLLHAKMAGCVPLYWGDSDPSSDVVAASFVNVSAAQTPEQVVEIVKRLESRPDLCEQIASTPLINADKRDEEMKRQKRMVDRLIGLLSSAAPAAASVTPITSALPAASPFLPRIATISVVNLDTRPDRWNRLLEAEPWMKTDSRVKRIAAVDGRKLTMTPFLYQLFQYNQYQWKKSAMGCMLSHIRIWTELSRAATVAATDTYHLILEDDVRFVEGWKETAEEMVRHAPADADVLYWGGVLPQNKVALPLASEAVNLQWSRIRPNSFFSPDTLAPIFHFCTFSYLLTAKGATKLMDFLTQSHLKAFAACDHFLGHPILPLKRYHSTPLLTYCFQEEDPAYQHSQFNELLRTDTFDSDIWNNTECFTEKDLEPYRGASPSRLAPSPPVPLQIHVLPGVSTTELYERVWLEDMFQRPIQLCEHTVENVMGVTRWHLVQRPHLATWNRIFDEYEQKGQPYAVLHLSDEFGQDDLAFYSHRMCKAVIRNYLRADVAAAPHILTVPLGYHHKATTEQCARRFEKREFVWSFHGTDWFQRGHQLQQFAEFVPNRCHLQPSWDHPTASTERVYLSTLTMSKCCPILRGNNDETFRFYEAVEAGTLPVTTMAVTEGGINQWIEKEMQLSQLYPWTDPMLVLASPTTYLNEDVRQSVCERWAAWKARIQADCSRVIGLTVQN